MDDSTTCYRHPDRPAATGCQRCDRPICTEDMKSASVGFHCPECVKQSGQRVYTPNSLTFGAQATKAIMAVNGLAYIAQQASPNGLNAGWLFGPLVQDGEWWRLLTSGFLHGSLIHIGFNMYLLWMLGPQLEKALGVPKFLLLYFGSLFGGSAAVMLFNWGSPTLGASGAVLGLAGGMAAIYQIRGYSIRQSPVFGLVMINLALPILVGGISFWGHLGGMIGGALVAAVLIFVPQKNLLPAKAVVPAAAAAVVGLAVLGVIGAMLQLPSVL